MTAASAQRLIYVSPIVDLWLMAHGSGAAEGAPLPLTLLAALTAAAALCSPSRRMRTPLAMLAAVAAVLQAANCFPNTSNHQYLYALSAVMLVACRGRASEQSDLATLVGVVMIWAGVQKLLYGEYVDGAFLHWLTQVDGRFDVALGWAPSGVIVALSNAVWLGEVLVGVGLLLEKTRAMAAMLGIALVVGIEVVTWELAFGALMTALLLSSSADRRVSKLGRGAMALLVLAALVAPLSGLKVY